MPKILVTGGCGYIGSHTIVDLIGHGFTTVSVDNLLNSNESALDGVAQITGQKVQNYRTDLCDLEGVRQVFRDHPDIQGVIHFAALKLVGESVEKPQLYYRNNVVGLLNLLECMQEAGVPHLIFSSSCSVYGNASELPVTESTPRQEAESPYARTKQIGEDILQDLTKVDPRINAILLRYFNPAGAHESARIGEDPSNPATNLVPVITETAAGKRAELVVFGNDYPTRDGSNVRDYIHVMDLANAHTKALQYNSSLPPTHFSLLSLTLAVQKPWKNNADHEHRYPIGSHRHQKSAGIFQRFSEEALSIVEDPFSYISADQAPGDAVQKGRTAMLITNTDFIPGREIIEVIDIARGSTVRARHIGRDISAVFRGIIGGEIDEYTKLMANAREDAIDRMIADAERIGADAVINVRFASSQIMQGASEILAYGTAVKLG
jgi:UDP-glucose 4-epimerase